MHRKLALILLSCIPCSAQVLFQAQNSTPTPVATGIGTTVSEPSYPPVCSQFQATKYLVSTNAVNIDPFNSTCGSTGGTNGTLGCTGGTDYEPSSTSASYTAAETTDNTAFQAALNACPSGQAVELVSGSSGQRAIVLSPVQIPSGVGIILDAGTEIDLSRNLSDYGGSNCGTVTTGTSFCNHWITAPNTTGSGIYGKGVINGRGWDAYIGQTTQSFYANRIQAYCNNWGGAKHGVPACTPNASGNNSYGPNAIDLVNANNFTLYGVTIKDGGNFQVNYQGGTGLTVWGVNVLAPFEVSNTDGIDPLDAKNVSIQYSNISVGDNHVAIKATDSASSNITVSNVQTGAGIALAIGANTLHGVSNVRFANVVGNGNLNNDQSAGLQIGSDASEGGLVNQVTFTNFCMRNERDTMRLFTNYGSKTGTNYPQYKNVLLSNITVLPSTSPYTTGNSGYFTFQGLSSYLMGVQFDNISVQGTNQGVAQQGGVTTDQYLTGILGPGSVASSILSQFSAGTSVTTSGLTRTATAYACSNSSWQPLIGSLNIKDGASNYNTKVSDGDVPLTLQVLLIPATDIDTHEASVAYPSQPVTILDNGVSIGTVTLGAAGNSGYYGYLTVNGPLTGTHVYTASYPGDTNYPAYTFGSVTATDQKVNYYVDSVSGSDANNGTNPATPWKTISKVNSFLSANGSNSLANVSILFKRGDVWHEQLQCISNLSSTTGWTTTTNPPMCSGSSSGQFVIGAYGVGANPIIDGADPLTLTWTLVAGTTWQATISGTMPCKLYVDGATAETTQLIPVPNATGAYNAATTYNPFDAVTDGDFYVRGCVTPSSGVDPTSNNAAVWLDNTNSAAGNTSQAFSTTNTGLQNVEATPGSWYGTGTTIYVNLADGSNPSGHTFEGTFRNYGVLLQSENYATVQNLTIEHPLYSCIASEVWSNDNGTYFTGEYDQFLNNHCYNWGSIVTDNLTSQQSPGHHFRLSGGIVVSADLQYEPHLLRGNLIESNTIGQSDAYFGQRYGYFTSYTAGIFAAGMDGGGIANNPVIVGNSVTTINTAGIVYNTEGLYTHTAVLLNNAGQVLNNSLTNNQGNIYFGSTAGGSVTGNTVKNSYGEGIQLGGESTSTQSQPQTISYNLIAHLGISASATLYNGIDCNTAGASVSGVYVLNNTIVDTNSANITFEQTGSVGCTAAHVHNNIFDQDVTRWPQGDIINPSYLMYFNGLGQTGADFSHNLWLNGTNSNPWHSPSLSWSTCSAFLSGWPDTNSICGVDPLFTNESSGDFSLQSGSPARGAGVGGLDLGAIPY